jgi:alpha-tubulin suppressor-like RCC1 family protein
VASLSLVTLLSTSGCWSILQGDLAQPDAAAQSDAGNDTGATLADATDTSSFLEAAEDSNTGTGSEGSGDADADADETDAGPPPVLSAIVTPSTLAAGATAACATLGTADGGVDDVYCWGKDNYGGPVLGNPRPTNPECAANGDCVLSNPTRRTVVAGSAHATQLSMHDNVACLLAPNDRVSCWGSCLHGRIGDPGGDVAALDHSPIQLETPQIELTNVAEIAVGSSFSCARFIGDAGVACWGVHLAANDDGFGQLTDDYDGLTDGGYDDSPFAVPIPPAGAFAGARHIAVGFSHACVVRADGGVSCWGANDYNQSGPTVAGAVCTRTDHTTHVPCLSSPRAVAGLSDVVQLALGSAHSCALQGDGQVLCWGRDADGVLGDANTLPKSTPLCSGTRPVNGTGGGMARCTGTPIAVVGLPRTVERIAASEATTCALAAGRVYCWGLDNVSQRGLGDANSTKPMTPVQRSFADAGTDDLVDIVDIAVANEFAVAKRRDGTFFQWGARPNGDLGTGYAVALPIVIP